MSFFNKFVGDGDKGVLTLLSFKWFAIIKLITQNLIAEKFDINLRSVSGYSGINLQMISPLGICYEWDGFVMKTCKKQTHLIQSENRLICYEYGQGQLHQWFKLKQVVLISDWNKSINVL